MKSRAKILAIFCVLLALTVLFVCLLVANIEKYSSLDITYASVRCESLSLDHYTKKTHARAGVDYVIYVKEYDVPFEFLGVSEDVLDRDALEALNEGDAITVCFRPEGTADLYYEICEISHGGVTILSLSDYIAFNRADCILGFVFCPFLILCLLFLMWIFCYLPLIVTKEKEEKRKRRLSKRAKRNNSAV